VPKLISIQRRHGVCGGSYIRCPTHFGDYGFDPDLCEDCRGLVTAAAAAGFAVCECWPLVTGHCSQADDCDCWGGDSHELEIAGSARCVRCGISANNPEGK
jgi:hypothetical protein